jgi:hypothetical protein
LLYRLSCVRSKYFLQNTVLRHSEKDIIPGVFYLKIIFPKNHSYQPFLFDVWAPRAFQEPKFLSEGADMYSCDGFIIPGMK